MSLEPDYKCGGCEKPTPRELLTVKRAVFLEMGEKPRTLRSRVVKWLCPQCIVSDADWNLQPYAKRSPGRQHSAIN